MTALTTAADKAPSFEHQVSTGVIKDVSSLAAKGPINAETAANIVNILPPFVTANTKPVPTYYGLPKQLVPNPDQGVRSWYWSCTQFFPQTGVILVLNQITIDPSSNTSVWSIYAGGTHPTTNVWVSSPTVYMDASAITIDAASGTTTVSVPGVVTASFQVQRGTTVISATFNATGFSFNATSTSKLGPQNEQPGSAQTFGGVVKNSYWSMFDGTVTSGMFQPSAADAPTTFNTNGGVSWLDYQQISLTKVTTPLRFLATLRPSFPSMFTSWTWVTVQDNTNGVWIAAHVLGRSKLDALLDGKTVTASANVWRRKPTNEQAGGKVLSWEMTGSFGVKATLKVTSKYQTVQLSRNQTSSSRDRLSSEVPSAVTIEADDLTYTVTSYSKTLPVLTNTAALTIFESPSIAKLVNVSESHPGHSRSFLMNTQARGVIEWLVQHSSPEDNRSAVRSAGLPATYTTNVTQPSTSSILILVMILLAVVIVAAVGTAIGLDVRYKHQSGKGGDTTAKRVGSGGFRENELY